MNIRVPVSFNSGFLGVYAQQWDCWVIRKFYFQIFIILPLGLALEAQSSPRVARESWGTRRVGGLLGVAGRLSGTVSPFRAEQGTSLETPSRARVT